MSFSLTAREWSELVYDGFACNAKSKDELKRQEEFCERLFGAVDAMKYNMACSGAMRWPWSQEATAKVTASVYFD